MSTLSGVFRETYTCSDNTPAADEATLILAIIKTRYYFITDDLASLNYILSPQCKQNEREERFINSSRGSRYTQVMGDLHTNRT